MTLRLRWAALAGVFILLCFFTPPDLPVCGFRWITGHPCPFCGLTHALFALGKGRVEEALHFHPLSPLAMLMIMGTVCSGSRMARLWTPCLAAFGAYGLWRVIL